MKYALALMAVAGIAASANAQSTRLIFEASVNGGPFLGGLQDVLPGSTVLVQVRAELSGATTLGLLGFNFNPRVQNWTAADVVTPFSATTGGVTGPTDTGRVRPFAGA